MEQTGASALPKHDSTNGGTFWSLAAETLRPLPRAISVAVALVPVAYLMGRIYLLSYFEVFGAKWLVPLVDARRTTHLAWEASGPALLIILVLVVSDIESVWRKKGSKKDVLKWWRSLCRFTLLLVVGSVVVSLSVRMFSDKTPGYLSLIPSEAIAALLLATLLVERWMGLDWRSWEVVSSCASIVICLVLFIPSQRGERQATLDLSPERSRLPVVKLKNESSRALRLLLKTHGELYAVELSESAESGIPIYLLSGPDVAAIFSHRGGLAESTLADEKAPKNNEARAQDSE